jgi:hypothetical protein
MRSSRSIGRILFLLIFFIITFTIGKENSEVTNSIAESKEDSSRFQKSLNLLPLFVQYL